MVFSSTKIIQFMYLVEARLVFSLGGMIVSLPQKQFLRIQCTGGPKIIGHPPAFEFKIIFYFQNMMLLASCLHACVHIFMQYLHLSFIILSLTIQMINKAKRKKLQSQNYRTPSSVLNSIILSYASNNVTHLFFLCIYRGKHLVELAGHDNNLIRLFFI